jgi:hypothetical protein
MAAVKHTCACPIFMVQGLISYQMETISPIAGQHPPPKELPGFPTCTHWISGDAPPSGGARGVYRVGVVLRTQLSGTSTSSCQPARREGR